MTSSELSRRKVLTGISAGAAGLVLGPVVGATGLGQPASAQSAPADLVSTRPVYAGLWQPSTAGQFLRLERNQDRLLAEYGEMWNQNFRLGSLTSYVVNGQVRYSGTYNPSSSGQALLLGRDHAGLAASFADMAAQNLRLGSLSAYVTGNQVRYDAVYNPGTASQILRRHCTHDQLLTEYGTLWNQGYRMAEMVSYVINGTVFYTAYFRPSTAGQFLRLGRSNANFVREIGEMRNQGFRLGSLSTHVSGGTVLYNATYNPGSVNQLVVVDQPHDRLVQTYGDQWNLGQRLALLVTDRVEGLSTGLMAQGIQSRMNGAVTGFAATVAGLGTRSSAAGGQRRTGTNPPARASSATARINIASINKTITAVAVLQLLAARGLSLNSRVSAFLPTSWSRGANVATITFRELMTHTSGIRNGGATDFAAMRTTIANGITLGNKTFSYQNQNFGLFRIIIPYLDGFSEAGVTDLDTATSNAYLAYVNRRVFSPIGIGTVSARPVGSEPTLSYPNPAGAVGGTHFGDWTKLCGGGCLHLSANELATFMVQLRQTTSLLPANQTATMTEQLLGWQGRTAVRHGHVNHHGGFLWAPVPTGNIELNTVVLSFSTGVHAALLVNSPTGGQNLWQVVVDAYQSAWVAL